MDWSEEQNHLAEQLEILKRLRDRFGEEAIQVASHARLAVHKRWMEKLSRGKSGRPSEIFGHSAFSVTSADENLLEYETLEDTNSKFAIQITRCRYADFYRENGEPGWLCHALRA